MAFIEIEIINWSRHQPRKDIKHPTWFALSNRILEDAKLFDLSPIEWKALIYIFCQASQQNSSKVSLNTVHAERVSAVPAKALRSAAERLANAGVTRTLRGRDVDDTRTIRDTTIQDNTHTQDNIAQPEGFADFWEGYPRKVGKSKTEALYRKAILAGAPPGDLVRARDCYVAHLRREGTEAKYIKHGPTFMASWPDWLDPTAGLTESFGNGDRPRGIAEILADEERGIA